MKWIACSEGKSIIITLGEILLRLSTPINGCLAQGDTFLRHFLQYTPFSYQRYYSRSWRSSTLPKMIPAIVSGVLYGYLKYKDCRKALEYGNALAAIKHSIIGDMAITDPDEIDSIIAEHKNTGHHSEMNR